MLLTLGGPILLCASVNGAFNYNVLPDVSYNVVRRIFPHAKEQDIITFIEDINSCKETEKRKDITLDFVENKFGTKLSRTDSPFDDHEYALHKMWSLLDQRAALVKFFDQANSQLKEKITMGLSSELFELFYYLDEKYDHLFPAASVAWIESIIITLSYTPPIDPKQLVEGVLMDHDPQAAFLLLYWQLYDQIIETNVLFL